MSIISSIKRIQQSKDAQRVFANFSYLSLLQIGSYVLPIITYPYLAKVIGVAGFGKIAFAMSLIVYFMTITDWGYNFTATRDVARNRENQEKISTIYSIVTTSKLCLLLISTIVLAIIIIFIPYLRENSIVIIFSFTMVIGYTIFPEWLFQGLENMKLIVILNLLSKLLFTILIFIFIQKPNDFILQPLFSGLGYIISGIISLIYIQKKLKIKFQLCTIKEVKQSIKGSFDVFLNNLMPNLYNSFSVMILGFCNGSIANGLLDGANKFYSICAQFLTVLSRAFFPFLSRKIEMHSIFVKIKFSITIFFALLLILGAKILVINILDPSFEAAIIPLQILGVSLIFHSLVNIYGTNYLIIIGEERLLRKIAMCVSILGFFCAFPLIYFYSYIGAACTIALARIILGITVVYIAKQKMKTLKGSLSNKA